MKFLKKFLKKISLIKLYMIKKKKRYKPLKKSLRFKKKKKSLSLKIGGSDPSSEDEKKKKKLILALNVVSSLILCTAIGRKRTKEIFLWK